MSDHMSKPLSAWKEDIIADGIVDATEVAQLRERLYEDGVIDREEAEFLFAINDAVSGAANDPGWQDLFVEAIASHVLEDEVSPGVVDDAEAAWLIEHIESDGVYDDVEKALLASIARRATSVAPALKGLLEKLGI